MWIFAEVLLILGLILANGFFAAAEIAILTARRSRLEQQAAAGNLAARLALGLARDPNRLLAVSQVGMSLVGTLAAVVGGAKLVGYFGGLIGRLPVEFIARRSDALALGLVVLGITFFSLVVGELVPKRLALRNAERLATMVAFPMHWLARIGRPAVWLLGRASEGILVLFGRHWQAAPTISIEDIEHLIKAGTKEGVLDPAEQLVARNALRLGDRTVRQIMRPRIEVDALDVDMPPDEVIGAAAMAGFSRLPVHEGDLDHILGYVYLKDLLLQRHMGWPIELRKLLRRPLFVPETLRIDKLLEAFRNRRTQMAIVLDEFGGTEGLVTLEDVLEELVGDIQDKHLTEHSQDIVERSPTTWLVNGSTPLGTLLARLGRPELRAEAPRDLNTVGGLVLEAFGRIPTAGDRAVWEGITLEVVAMDAQRVERVLVTTGDAR